MPIVAVFDGIVIQTFHRDHGPAHVHAKCQGHEAQVRMADGEIHRGRLPPATEMPIAGWWEALWPDPVGVLAEPAASRSITRPQVI